MSIRLFAGVTCLGTLKYVDSDHPREYYSFQPSTEYEDYRDVLDLKGKTVASSAMRREVEKLDLRVDWGNGDITRYRFVFIDDRRVTLRAGFARELRKGGRTNEAV